MPFHVEISTPLRHARSFNLDAAELQRAIVDPWLGGRPIDLGGRRWAPAKSRLKILEGPALDTPELSFGQGWANAERASSNVTRSLLAAAREERAVEPVALVVEAPAPEQAVAEMIEGRSARRVDPASLRARLDGRDPTVAAVIVVVRR